MSARRKPTQTLGELQPPAGLRSLVDSARSLFIEIARELKPEIDGSLFALCPPWQPAVEPAVLATWARRFNLNVDWFRARAANVLETRWEKNSQKALDELVACPNYGRDLWPRDSWLDAAWRISRVSVEGQTAPKIRRLPNGEERAYWPKPKPAPESWELRVELQPWRWPQAWDADPKSESASYLSESYMAYVYRTIAPKLIAYRAEVLRRLDADGYQPPPEFDSLEVFKWLARRVVNRKSAYAIAKNLPPGDNRHRSGIDAQTVKLARYLKLKIPPSLRFISR